MIADWIKEWAIVISGGATFLLAIAAFCAIRQTRGIQKSEKRQRLLNEIIVWAEDILLSGWGETVREKWATYSNEQKTDRQFAMRKGHGFMDIRDKGIRIIYKSSYIDIDLGSHALSTIKLLQQHIDKWTQAKDGQIKDWSEIVDHKSELDEHARQLIKKATALI